jgi:bla regulator protein blaR1
MTIPLGWCQSWIAAAVNHLWQSTLVVGVAWLLAIALRNNNARARYWVWFAASVKFLLPFSLLVAGGEWLRSLLPVVAVEQPAVAQAMERMTQPFSGSEYFRPEAPVEAHHVSWLPWMLLAVWASGAAVAVSRLVWEWWRVHQAKRVATPVDLAIDVPVFSSTARMEPGILGILRPALLLPEGILERLTVEQLRTIVAHEMYHVRKRDNLTFAIHMTVEILFWFYPPVWWIRSRLIEERECACDEAVLQTGSAAHVYAASILNVCKFCIEPPPACTSGVTGSNLDKRIRRILAGYTVRRLEWSRKLLLASAGLAAFFLPIFFGLQHATPSWAQARVEAPKNLPAFEVATVKPSPPGDTMVMAKATPDGMLIRNAPLIFVIHLAAGFLNANDDQIIGAPSWVKTERYDIAAKVNESDVPKLAKLSRIEKDEMIMPVLADRFGFTARWETRELPIYDLVEAKGGSKLHEAKPGDTYPDGLKDDQGQSSPGMVRVGLGTVDCQAVPITSLLEILSNLAGRTVLDKTGLTAKYDIKLRWRPEGLRANPAEGGGDASEESDVDFFTAIQEQLGLRLIPAKGPVHVLVVDHIGKPSPN